MNVKSILAVLLLLLLASGCTVRGPSVKMEVPGVEIGVVGGATHCPPGQAKKGNC
ncbi:MAG: hypothetical protein PVJ39_13090 [Gammaproteobacteria bacterium]